MANGGKKKLSSKKVDSTKSAHDAVKHRFNDGDVVITEWEGKIYTAMIHQRSVSYTVPDVPMGVYFISYKGWSYRKFCEWKFEDELESVSNSPPDGERRDELIYNLSCRRHGRVRRDASRQSQTNNGRQSGTGTSIESGEVIPPTRGVGLEADEVEWFIVPPRVKGWLLEDRDKSLAGWIIPLPRTPCLKAAVYRYLDEVGALTVSKDEEEVHDNNTSSAKQKKGRDSKRQEKRRGGGIPRSDEPHNGCDTEMGLSGEEERRLRDEPDGGENNCIAYVVLSEVLGNLFNRVALSCLLYPIESVYVKSKCGVVVEDDTLGPSGCLSSVLGVEHFLRFIIKLPSFLKNVRGLSRQTKRQLVNVVNSFLNYVDANATDLITMHQAAPQHYLQDFTDDVFKE